MSSSVPCARPARDRHARSALRSVTPDARPPADDLPRRFASGDADVLPVLHATYARPMLTAALHIFNGDRRLAEEAVQLAMLKAWRGASTYDPTRPLSSWLFAIVRRCAIDIWRQERRHRLPSRDDTAGQAEPTTSDGFEAAARAWAVREALGALPAREYDIMRLAYFEGLTQVEIAERLALPVGTVKSRTTSAHRRLRAELGWQLALAS